MALECFIEGIEGNSKIRKKMHVEVIQGREKLKKNLKRDGVNEKNVFFYCIA